MLPVLYVLVVVLSLQTELCAGGSRWLRLIDAGQPCDDVGSSEEAKELTAADT